MNRSGYITVMHAEPQDMPLFSSKENGKVNAMGSHNRGGENSAGLIAIGIKAGSDCFGIVSHPIFQSRSVDIFRNAGVCWILVGKIEVLASLW